MKPIQVKISNFQSIESAQFEICGFTALSGNTNIGKSAIIRSISSSLANLPVVGMVRRGEKFCTVELHSEDWGYKWEKGEKGVNRYHIDGKENVLDNVGQGQIQEIVDFGFGSIKVGKGRGINPWHSTQFDPIFLMNKNGTAVTDFISEVNRLDVLQNGIIISNRGRRKFKERSKITKEDLSRLTSKREKFGRMDELKQIATELSLQQKSINEYEERIKLGQNISMKMKREGEKISILTSAAATKIPSLPKEENFHKLKKCYDLNRKLKRCAASIISIKAISDTKIPEAIEIEEINRLAAGIKISNGMNACKSAISDMSRNVPIPELDDEIGLNIEKIKMMKSFSQAMQKIAEEIREFSTSEKIAMKEVETIESMIQKIPRCPTCEQPWDSGHQSHS